MVGLSFLLLLSVVVSLCVVCKLRNYLKNVLCHDVISAEFDVELQ